MTIIIIMTTVTVMMLLMMMCKWIFFYYMICLCWRVSVDNLIFRKDEKTYKLLEMFKNTIFDIHTGPDTILGVDFTPCSTQPTCKFERGTNVTVTINFKTLKEGEFC